jgi:hypothetical protein
MHDRAVAQVVREDQLVRVVSPADVDVLAVDREVDLLRGRRAWRVTLRRLMLERLVTRVPDPDDQRGPRGLVERVVHRPTDRQEGRVAHVVRASRLDKVVLALKETQESQDQVRRGMIGSRKGPQHTNPDWALRSPQEVTVSRASG